MAIKKADALTAQSMLYQVLVANAEGTIDEAIKTRYFPGEVLRFRLSNIVSNDRVYAAIEELYTAAGWNVRKGWRGSQDDGYSTLELS